MSVLLSVGTSAAQLTRGWRAMRAPHAVPTFTRFMVDMGMGAWMVAGRGFDGVLNFTCARVV